MKDPKVSIVIPVYNGAEFLQEAIDSALNQTYNNCEVIVVNDGSSDDTDTICRRYGDSIKYYKKQNGGVSTAFNCGVKNMHGDYFSLFTHDDIYYPNKIELQINALMESGNLRSPCFGDYDIIDSFTNRVTSSNFEKSFDLEFLCDSVYGLLYGAVNSVTVLLHRDYFSELGLFDVQQRTTQDYDMWFRAFRNQKCVYVDKPLIKWRHHSGQDSITSHAHIANQEKQHLAFYEALTDDEINRMFGSRYQFYYEMIQFNKSAGFNNCMKYSEQKFREENEPESANIIRGELKKFILSWGTGNPKKIVVFGAGGRGKKLQNDLKLRGIDIDLFIDNHTEAAFINGVKCEKPNFESIKNAVILITPFGCNNEIRSQLMELGTTNWLLLEEVNKRLRRVPPIKLLVKEVI